MKKLFFGVNWQKNCGGKVGKEKRNWGESGSICTQNAHGAFARGNSNEDIHDHEKGHASQVFRWTFFTRIVL